MFNFGVTVFESDFHEYGIRKFRLIHVRWSCGYFFCGIIGLECRCLGNRECITLAAYSHVSLRARKLCS